MNPEAPAETRGKRPGRGPAKRRPDSQLPPAAGVTAATLGLLAVECQTLDCQASVNLEMPAQYPLRPYGTDVSHLRHCFHDGFPMGDADNSLVYKQSLFCSTACALAFVDLDERPRILYEFLPDAPFDAVPLVAPPRQLLKAYGGRMPLAKFRNCAPLSFSSDEPRCCYDCHVIEDAPFMFQNASFCSRKCILASIVENTRVGSVVETNFRADHLDVVPAPPRALLATFGGFMSIEEFRAATNFYVIHPPRSLAPDGTISEAELPTYSMRRPHDPSQPLVARPAVNVQAAASPLSKSRLSRGVRLSRASTSGYGVRKLPSLPVSVGNPPSRGTVHLPFVQRNPQK